jgi:hypothetical protein
VAKEKTHDTSLRADMEAAMEQVENATEQPTEELESTLEDTESESPAEEKTEAPQEVSEPAQKQSAEPPATEVRAEVDRKQPAREVKAPVDWTPALREKWKGVDPEVREWIHNRQVNRSVDAVTRRSSLRRICAGVGTVSPADGRRRVQNPLQAFEGLMKVTATLAMGSQSQKAQTIANFVKHYNIDIETLDQALAGSLPAPDPQRTQLEQLLEQRLAPVNQLLERVNNAEQSQQQQIYGQAHQSIEQFGLDPKNEFFEDVRYDMADMLDFASQRGQSMSLKKAYDLACAQHEGVQQVISTRAQPRTLRDKRSAASSLASRGTEGNHSTERSLREELEAQWGEDARIA